MAIENTGYKAYTNLLKVTNDGTERPLDDNNMLCSDTGLPQSVKDNLTTDIDYIPPFEDLTACPLPT